MVQASNLRPSGVSDSSSRSMAVASQNLMGWTAPRFDNGLNQRATMVPRNSARETPIARGTKVSVLSLLLSAVRVQWPKIAIHRCTNHKLWNLLAKAVAHLREKLAEDYGITVKSARR
jgi:hypothetical protein